MGDELVKCPSCGWYKTGREGVADLLSFGLTWLAFMLVPVGLIWTIGGALWVSKGIGPHEDAIVAVLGLVPLALGLGAWSIHRRLDNMGSMRCHLCGYRWKG